MITTAIFAFLHHVLAFALVACVVVQFALLNGELTLANARRLQRYDMLLGASAGGVFIIGLIRVFMFEKGFDYYSGSAFFWAKMALFLFTGLASVVPTIEFLSWRKATNQGQVPTPDPAKLRTVRMLVHAELAAVVLILLCAAMMARGVELF
jgi:putative membrane protein